MSKLSFLIHSVVINFLYFLCTRGFDWFYEAKTGSFEFNGKSYYPLQYENKWMLLKCIQINYFCINLF